MAFHTALHSPKLLGVGGNCISFHFISFSKDTETWHVTICLVLCAQQLRVADTRMHVKIHHGN